MADQHDGKAERRAQARRRLLGGGGAEPPKREAVAFDPVVRATAAAFADYCEAAVELCELSQAAAQGLAEEISQRAEGDRHAHRLVLLDRLYRGCRVRIVRCTDLLNGCECLVLNKSALGSEKKLPVRCTMPDGQSEELWLRPDQLLLVQGRRDAQQEEAERIAFENAENAEAAAQRWLSSQPHVIQQELHAELRGKSFMELRKMAEAIHEGEMLLCNPLLQYDRAAFRDALIELLMRSEDGGEVLNTLVADATRAEDCAKAEAAALASIGELDEEDCEAVEVAAHVVETAMASAFGPALPPGGTFCGPFAIDAQAGCEVPGSAPCEDEDDAPVYGPAAFGPAVRPSTLVSVSEVAAEEAAEEAERAEALAAVLASAWSAGGNDEEGEGEEGAEVQVTTALAPPPAALW